MILVQWADLARQVGIRVCDDHVAGVRFLELVAPDAGELELLRHVVERHIEILPWEQLVESLARKPDDTLALRRLGLAAPTEFSQPVFDAINNGLSTPIPPPCATLQPWQPGQRAGRSGHRC